MLRTIEEMQSADPEVVLLARCYDLIINHWHEPDPPDPRSDLARHLDSLASRARESAGRCKNPRARRRFARVARHLRAEIARRA